jgi:hypothetical protein
MISKALYVISATLCFISFGAIAQGPGGPPHPKQRERVESMKIGFLTDRLQLTPEEAKVFWPVYDQYQDELEKLRKSRKENLLNGKENIDDLSDADIEKLVDGEIAFRQSELDLIKKYHPQFKKILPIRKVGRLYKAEEEFKRELLRKLQEKGNDRKPGPPGGGPRR